MRIPDTLSALVDQGVIEQVLRPLMSGKEAQIYLVVAGGTECVAKIYKEADNRTFKHRADYTEGRKVRNSRDQRAIDKRSKHGRGQDEAAWRSTEVDMIYRLRAAGVRVPAPHNYIDGVLVMELVTDGHGEPAPRLGDLDFTPEEATWIYERLVRDVVRMLCAGVVHGDLSDFNVLLGADGPVIIDLPQAVDPSKNQNARKLLLRDVDNLHRFYTRFVPNARRLPYAEEMWALYESNQLTPETVLRGQYRGAEKKANVDSLMEFIGEVNEDERRRRTAIGLDSSKVPPKPRRVEVIVDKTATRGARPPFVNGTRAAPATGRVARPAHGAPPARAQAPRSAAPRPATPRPAAPRAAAPRAAAPPRPMASHSESVDGPRHAALPVPAAASTEPGLGQPSKRRRRRRKAKAAPGAALQHGPEGIRSPHPERQPPRSDGGFQPPARPERLAPRPPAPMAQGSDGPQRGFERAPRPAPARLQPAPPALDVSRQTPERPQRPPSQPPQQPRKASALRAASALRDRRER